MKHQNITEKNITEVNAPEAHVTESGAAEPDITDQNAVNRLVTGDDPRDRGDFAMHLTHTGMAKEGNTSTGSEDYPRAGKFLDHISQKGVCYGLETIRSLMERLGNVQDRLRVIHVAGTNGKGSVCACISSILQAAGFKTGLYSSPAVFHRREIIRINGVPVPERDFARFTGMVRMECERMEREGLAHPSVFEIETAVAFCYFYNEHCDFVVLEAGMGGALDATNVTASPVCSVFTSISRDHMSFLGDTLEEIALAKAGIIRAGCPCVTAAQKPEVLRVLVAAARAAGSRLWQAQEDLVCEYEYDRQESRFRLSYEDWEKPDGEKPQAMREGLSGALVRTEPEIIHCGLTGAWQRENIACALTVIRLLVRQGFLIPGQAVAAGLSGVKLPGRFERIYTAPDLYIDGAHNEGAALALEKTVRDCFAGTRLVYITGVLADKEYDRVLRLMLPHAQRVFTITPDHPRALAGSVLAGEAGKYHPDVTDVPSVPQAVRQAVEAAGREGAVLAFGSFSFLNELKRAVRELS